MPPDLAQRTLDNALRAIWSGATRSQQSLLFPTFELVRFLDDWLKLGSRFACAVNHLVVQTGAFLVCHWQDPR